MKLLWEVIMVNIKGLWRQNRRHGVTKMA